MGGFWDSISSIGSKVTGAISTIGEKGLKGFNTIGHAATGLAQRALDNPVINAALMSDPELYASVQGGLMAANEVLGVTQAAQDTIFGVEPPKKPSYDGLQKKQPAKSAQGGFTQSKEDRDKWLSVNKGNQGQPRPPLPSRPSPGARDKIWRDVGIANAQSGYTDPVRAQRPVRPAPPVSMVLPVHYAPPPRSAAPRGRRGGPTYA